MANDAVSKITALFGLIGEADTLLEQSWQRHSWGGFVRTWLISSVALALTAFVLPFVFFMLPSMIYGVISTFMHTKGSSVSFSETLEFALRFGGVVGGVFLLSAIPAMMFKQMCGDWKMAD